MKFIFSLAIILWTAFLASEEPIWQTEKPAGFSVKVFASSKNAILGAPFAVTLETQYPEGYEIDLERVRENLLKQLRPGSIPFLVNEVSDKTETVSPSKKKKMTFWLEPQATGKQFFSFWNISFESVNPQKEKITIASPVFQLSIDPMPLEFDLEPMISPFLIKRETFPIDISAENKRAFLLNPSIEREKALHNVNVLNNKKFPWIPLIAFLAAGFLLLTGRKRKKTSQLKIKNTKQEALDQLKILQELLPTISVERFYTELIRVLRTFIEESYHVPIDTQTTEEFLKNISKTHLFNKRMESTLSIFLEYADKIRFGKQKATSEECQRVLGLIAEFIQKS